MSTAPDNIERLTIAVPSTRVPPGSTLVAGLLLVPPRYKLASAYLTVTAYCVSGVVTGVDSTVAKAVEVLLVRAANQSAALYVGADPGTTASVTATTPVVCQAGLYQVIVKNHLLGASVELSASATAILEHA